MKDPNACKCTIPPAKIDERLKAMGEWSKRDNTLPTVMIGLKADRPLGITTYWPEVHDIEDVATVLRMALNAIVKEHNLGTDSDGFFVKKSAEKARKATRWWPF